MKKVLIATLFSLFSLPALCSQSPIKHTILDNGADLFQYREKASHKTNYETSYGAFALISDIVIETKNISEDDGTKGLFHFVNFDKDKTRYVEFFVGDVIPFDKTQVISIGASINDERYKNLKVLYLKSRNSIRAYETVKGKTLDSNIVIKTSQAYKEIEMSVLNKGTHINMTNEITLTLKDGRQFNYKTNGINRVMSLVSLDLKDDRKLKNKNKRYIDFSKPDWTKKKFAHLSQAKYKGKKYGFAIDVNNWWYPSRSVGHFVKVNQILGDYVLFTGDANIMIKREQLSCESFNIGTTLTHCVRFIGKLRDKKLVNQRGFPVEYEEFEVINKEAFNYAHSSPYLYSRPNAREY